MTRRFVVVLGAAITIACGEDPARSVRIPRASASSVVATATTALSPALHWNAAMCQSAAETPGPSSVVGTGACAFEQHLGATCALTDDDLLMKVARPMTDGGQLVMFVTVENFGRRRQQVEVVVGVENAQGLFRWTTDAAEATVGPEQKFVTFAETHLTAVAPLKEQEVVVSGTLTCASTAHAPDAR